MFLGLSRQRLLKKSGPTRHFLLKLLPDCQSFHIYNISRIVEKKIKNMYLPFLDIFFPTVIWERDGSGAFRGP